MADNQENQGGFPQNQSTGQDTHSTTGDGHPPRPGEKGYDSSKQGGGSSQSQGNSAPAGQPETGGTGGYGGTSDASGGGNAS
jgi:hypothetical protein